MEPKNWTRQMGRNTPYAEWYEDLKQCRGE
jgi:hypothetical protein